MNLRSLTLTAVALASFAASSHGAFHVMQIEEIFGGIAGNTSAQAIQLRLRSAGQNLVSNAKLWAWDANGTNRVLLLDIASNVSNSASGARILLTTSAFTSTMIAGGATTFTPDFTLANNIPASYLNAGRLTFEDDGGNTATAGTIYWSVSWGGGSYFGSQTGSTQNDVDGNFGPAFGSALPRNTRQGVVFTGTASAPSTSNSANYAFSSNPGTVTKNNGTAFTVVTPLADVPEPGTCALLALVGLGTFAVARRRA